jgi:hypothetical protein
MARRDQVKVSSMEPALKAFEPTLLAQTTVQVRSRVREIWESHLGADQMLSAITAFGDLILSDRSGQVLFFDLLEADLRLLARSWDEFTTNLRAAEARDEIFLEGFVEALRASGIVLSQGQCYGFKVPPVLGGDLALANIDVMQIPVYEHLMESVHRDVASGRAGERIDGLTVDGSAPREK